MRSTIAFACREAVRTSPRVRTASAYLVRQELNEITLIPFGNQILKGSVKRASIKGLVSKIKEIYQGFQKAPKLWEQFKEMLGITSTNVLSLYKELSTKFEKFLDEGKKWIDSKKKSLEDKYAFVRFFFAYANNAPTLTSLVTDLIKKLPEDKRDSVSSYVGKLTKGTRSLTDWITKFLEANPLLSALTTPAKAYIFWIIWVNVTEVSWKITDILKGFLGLISWGELLASLPESGLGFLVTLMFPGIPGGWVMKSLQIGWNALIIPTLGLQLYWLYKNGYLKAKEVGV